MTAAVVLGFLGAAGAAGWAVVQSQLPRPDPLAAFVEFTNDECVQVVMDASTLRDLPERDAFTVEWAYENGAAEQSKGQFIDLIVQGTSSDVVVLHSLEVVDLVVEPLPSNPVTVTKCAPVGGTLASRYFDLDLLQSPTTFTAAVGEEADPGVEPIEFPYTISSTEPERLFITQLVESDSCVCTWRLAIRWSSGSREGVLVIDRGFSSIRTAVAPGIPMRVWNEDGTWDEY